jgi:phosphoribosylamine--glycine ligase
MNKNQDKFRVLVVGGGGREHALAWKLSRSPDLGKLFAAPGNPGMEPMAECVPLQTTEMEEIAAFAERERIDLVVVGPEVPLSMGIADLLAARGIPCFGPVAKATRLESSKTFAKDFMTRHRIPTASYRAFGADATEEAYRYLDGLPDGPVVVKADGLAQGKGVVVAENRARAREAVADLVEGKMGEAGSSFIIEECLTGEELSLLCLSDGKTLLPMLPVQDFKRVFDGDLGPNTGGMGSYSPVSLYTPEIRRAVEADILQPLRAALSAEDFDYRGCLYVGLMLTPLGPRVIEFNARFGDPETQAMLPLLKSDFLHLALGCATGRLENTPLDWSSDMSVCVVMVSCGYPGKYPTGCLISGLPDVGNGMESGSVAPGAFIFHSGTAKDAQGRIVTAGGRVLSVTAIGSTFESAREKAYALVRTIRFQGNAFRGDIGVRELNRLKAVARLS